MPRPLTSRTLARRAALWAADKKALDVIVLDLRKIVDFTDYFVICTGAVDVHVQAIGEHIQNELERQGRKPFHVEGADSNRWLLLDYVDFVVHIFQPHVRSFYALERLWGDAPVVKIKGISN